MSNVIDFLERIGQDAQLRHASADELELALADARVERGLQSVILASDLSQLHALLGKGPLCSIQVPAEEEEEDEGEGEGDEDAGAGEEIASWKGEGLLRGRPSRELA
jgi:hypothetical protein